jgi:hypothetical protein
MIARLPLFCLAISRGPLHPALDEWPFALGADVKQPNSNHLLGLTTPPLRRCHAGRVLLITHRRSPWPKYCVRRAPATVELALTVRPRIACRSQHCCTNGPDLIEESPLCQRPHKNDPAMVRTPPRSGLRNALRRCGRPDAIFGIVGDDDCAITIQGARPDGAPGRSVQ